MFTTSTETDGRYKIGTIMEDGIAVAHIYHERFGYVARLHDELAKGFNTFREAMLYAEQKIQDRFGKLIIFMEV